MVNPLKWVWQQADWPAWRFDAAAPLAAPLAARPAQDEAVGRAQLLTPTLDASADRTSGARRGSTRARSRARNSTSNPYAVQSHVDSASILENSKAAPAPRAVEGLIDVLQDATQNYEKPLTLEQLNALASGALSDRAFRLLRNSRRTTSAAKRQCASSPAPCVSANSCTRRAPPRRLSEHEVQTFLDWFNGKSRARRPRARGACSSDG